MENNQRNSRKRLNSLVLLVAFTAVMLIVSTYAWFSAQKNVTLGGLKGTVKVAEGLEISLDAANWSQEVDFSQYTEDTLKTLYRVMSPGDDDDSEDYAYYSREDGKGVTRAENTLGTDAPEHNIVPSELLPVSTTGKTNDGIGQKDMKMYRGENTNTIELKNIIQVLQRTSGKTTTGDGSEDLTESHHDYPGYYAIDMFLRNSSSTTESGTTNRSDILQLNNNSLLRLTNASANSTGLQNTVRVAFAIYNANAAVVTESSTDSDEDVTSDDWNEGLPNMATSTYMTAAQQQILNAYKEQNIADVAIWEPNASDHVQYVVNNNNNKPADTALTAKHLYGAADLKSFPMTQIGTTGRYQFGLSTPMRTFALTSTATSLTTKLADNTTVGIANIYDWSRNEGASGTNKATTAGLDTQVTLQTEKTSETDFKIANGIKNLVSVTSDDRIKYTRGDEQDVEVLKADGSTVETASVTNFKMAKGTVAKVRMYVWLEGQDVDTINHASHGGGVYLDVGLLKDGKLDS